MTDVSTPHVSASDVFADGTRWSAASRRERIDALFAGTAVLPVLTIADLAHALPLARTLRDAGLRVLEVTLRTPVALEAIARIAAGLPDVVVGAGTVVRGSDLEDAARAGAAFAISPGATPALYAAAQATSIPWLPAIATASELMLGLEQGYERFKFYPAASAGGPAALRAFAAPFPQARFCPTGGIEPAAAANWLALPNVFALGGSWMLPSAVVQAGDWGTISRLAGEAAALGAAAAALGPLAGKRQRA